MPAKKVAQKKGGQAGKTRKWMPPAFSSSDNEDSPSLQDLAEKIAALEKAKVRKHSAEVNSEATPSKNTRAAARKRELRVLYSWLAQLQELDEEDNVQLVMGGDHLLQATKAKIWRGEYVDMFTLLFRDVELKASMWDDPRELEKIKRMQIDKNFDNWLSAYTIYMGWYYRLIQTVGHCLLNTWTSFTKPTRNTLGPGG
ncbi:UNVERIFIED_CONTAM: hypothetical protein K2H54_073610 [Gekko kuhli]